MSQLNDAVMLKDLDRLMGLSDEVDFHGTKKDASEQAFLLAAQYSNSEMVQWFLDQNPPSDMINTAAHRAAYADHLDSFKLLLPYTKKGGEKYSGLFLYCATLNFIAGMKSFDLDYIQVAALHNAMFEALSDENHDIVMLLLDRVSYDDVRRHGKNKQAFADSGEDVDAILSLYSQYQKSLEEHDTISNEVCSSSASRTTRKL